MKSSNRGFEATININGRPVTEVDHKDTTYIEGRKGSEYSLHFNNKENRRVLIIPSVDGLCTIDGKPAGKNSAGFIIDAHDSINITGWTVDNSTAAKFTFWPQDARSETTYIESLSKDGATVDVGNQGMIGFLVIEEHFIPTLNISGNISTTDLTTWNSAGFDTTDLSKNMEIRGICCSANNTNTLTMNLPNDIPVVSDWYSEDDNTGMGTKFGESIEFATSVGKFNRGRTVGEFVFEYDTLRGLKDRGVPVNKFKKSGTSYGKKSAFPADDSIGCNPPAGWTK